VASLAFLRQICKFWLFVRFFSLDFFIFEKLDFLIKAVFDHINFYVGLVDLKIILTDFWKLFLDKE